MRLASARAEQKTQCSGNSRLRWIRTAPALHYQSATTRHKSGDFTRKPYNSPMDFVAPTFNQRDVRRRLAEAAQSFNDADFVHRSSFDGLLERLEPIVIEPPVILDLGAASGRGSRALAKTYGRSRILSLDVSPEMLRLARSRKSFFSKISELQGDALKLPLMTGSVDMVFANLLLPWIEDLPHCLREINRVLCRGGLFAFSTLGPDSFAELRDAWLVDRDYAHVRSFADMHDIGDALLQAGLLDPIVDVDRLSITYRDSASLFRDLTANGLRNSLAGRRRSLLGRNRFERLLEALGLDGRGAPLSLGLEQIFGHAWGSGPQPEDGVFHVAADSISRRRRN